MLVELCLDVSGAMFSISGGMFNVSGAMLVVHVGTCWNMLRFPRSAGIFWILLQRAETCSALLGLLGPAGTC